MDKLIEVMENKIMENPQAFSNVNMNEVNKYDYKWDESYTKGINVDILKLKFLLEALIKCDVNVEDNLEHLHILSLSCYEKDGALEIKEEDASIMYTHVKWEVINMCKSRFKSIHERRILDSIK